MSLTTKQFLWPFELVSTLLFSFAALALMVVDVNNWAGWLAMGLSFWVLLSERGIKNNLFLYFICCIILIMYHAVSFINISFLPIDANTDARGFILSAHQILAGFSYDKIYYCTAGTDFFHLIGACFYSSFLSYAYSINDSVFFGQELNILAVAMSMVYLCKFTKLLQLNKFTIVIVFLLSLFPQYLLWRAVTLREAWEFLLLIMVVYHGLRYRLEKKSWLHLFWIMLLCFLTSLWHNVLMAYIPFLFLFIILYPFDSSYRFSFEKFLINYVLICLLGGIAVYLILHFLVFIPHTAGVDSNVSLDVGNAGYNIMRDWSSLFSIIKTLLTDFYYYLFTPMPWQVKSTAGFFAMIYVFIRIFLLGLVFLNYKNLSSVQKRIYTFLLMIYFSCSLIWSVGTFNYGQAIRHQMLTDWILVMLGIPILMNKITLLCVCGNNEQRT